MSAPSVPVLLVDDLDASRRFYVHALGCRVIETTLSRLSLELHGHPLQLRSTSVPDDGDDPFLGAPLGEPSAEAAFLLGVDDWCGASERLREHAVEHAVEPGRRFSAVPGEQCGMRLADPDGNEIVLLGFAHEANQLAA